MTETMGGFSWLLHLLDIAVVSVIIYHFLLLLRGVGMDHADIRPIDAHYVDGSERFAIRYFDFEERVIVAYEFNADFAYLGEHRVHIDEWMGEDYYNFPWAIFCPESL